MKTKSYTSEAELQSGLAHIQASPKDAGILELIVRRPNIGEREIIQSGKLDIETGLAGDNWQTRGSSRTKNGSAHPDMQVTLMNARMIGLITRDKSEWALAGDQLYVDFDLSQENIPPGTQLQIGESTIEITAEPHTGCKKFKERFGLPAMKFISSPQGKRLNLRGVNARVIHPGAISVNDSITKRVD